MCRLSLCREHTATDGGNLTGFFKLHYFSSSSSSNTSEEAILNLWSLSGNTTFCMIGKILVTQEVQNLKLCPSYPVKWSICCTVLVWFPGCNWTAEFTTSVEVRMNPVLLVTSSFNFLLFHQMTNVPSPPDDMYILQQYTPVSVYTVSSSNCHRIASCVLCESGLKP